MEIETNNEVEMEKDSFELLKAKVLKQLQENEEKLRMVNGELPRC